MTREGVMERSRGRLYAPERAARHIFREGLPSRASHRRIRGSPRLSMPARVERGLFKPRARVGVGRRGAGDSRSEPRLKHRRTGVSSNRPERAKRTAYRARDKVQRIYPLPRVRGEKPRRNLFPKHPVAPTSTAARRRPSCKSMRRGILPYPILSIGARAAVGRRPGRIPQTEFAV